MLNSLVTMVATPEKCPGREAPHKTDIILSGGMTWVASISPPISSTVGTKTTSTPNSSHS